MLCLAFFAVLLPLSARALYLVLVLPGPRLPGVSRKHPALVAKGVEECWDLGAQECVADVLLPWLDHYRLNCLDEPWSRDPKI